MSTKPKEGGQVRISYKQYTVLLKPRRTETAFRLLISDPATYEVFWAESALAQCGCGPWKIVERAVTQPSN